MFKIAPVVLALSSVALHTASSAPSWYPRNVLQLITARMSSTSSGYHQPKGVLAK